MSSSFDRKIYPDSSRARKLFIEKYYIFYVFVMLSYLISFLFMDESSSSGIFGIEPLYIVLSVIWIIFIPMLFVGNVFGGGAGTIQSAFDLLSPIGFGLTLYAIYIAIKLMLTPPDKNFKEQEDHL